MSNKAVFLDRDGVLNVAPVVDGRPGSPRHLSELHIAPGAAEALQCLRAAGFKLIVITNQPEVARGKISLETLDALHAALRAQLPIDEIRVCLHDKGDGCDCRKPRPGMILDAARDAGLDLSGSYVIGDRWRDVEAGRRAGCRTVLIDYGYDEPDVPPDYRARSIREAADWVLQDAAAPSPQERLGRLRVKLFCDGADLAAVRELSANPLIKGFTTSPTLMRKAGVTSYEAFARDVIAIVAPRPVSLEVFADEAEEMERQARTIAGWGENAYVKIPVTNTSGETMAPLVGKLARAGVKVNVTAVFTLNQVRDVASQLSPDTPSCVSIFAGRIADAGRDPEPIVGAALTMLQSLPTAEVIWASPRELLNIFQADRTGCHIIIVSSDLLKRIESIGRGLDAYSLDTVRQFFADAGAGGYRL